MTAADPAPARLVSDADELDDAGLHALYPDAGGGWLRVNMVASVDGAVDVHGRSGGLSSPTDRRLLRLLRTGCDALLVGAGTVRVEGYAPPLVDGAHADPVLVVVSGTLALDPAAPAFARAAARPVVLTGPDAPADRRAALATVADVVPAADLATGLDLLHRRGLRRILCEGGPTLLGELVAADLVDELCLTVAPVLAGPGSGRIVAGPAAPTSAKSSALGSGAGPRTDPAGSSRTDPAGGPGAGALRRLSLAHVAVAPDGLFLRYRRAG